MLRFFLFLPFSLILSLVSLKIPPTFLSSESSHLPLLSPSINGSCHRVSSAFCAFSASRVTRTSFQISLSCSMLRFSFLSLFLKFASRHDSKPAHTTFRKWSIPELRTVSLSTSAESWLHERVTPRTSLIGGSPTRYRDYPKSRVCRFVLTAIAEIEC